MIRQLYRLPSATVLNLGLSSRRQRPWFGEKYSWSTQLNVRNALNHHRVWVVPSAANGAVLNAPATTIHLGEYAEYLKKQLRTALCARAVECIGFSLGRFPRVSISITGHAHAQVIALVPP